MFNKMIDRFETYYYKIKRSYIQYVKPFYNIYNYKKLFKWIPVIWNDREWDYIFFLDIIKFKLKKDSSFYENNGVSVNSKKVAKQMKLCIALIDRIKNDDYCSDMLDKIDEKYGEFITVPSDKPDCFILTRNKFDENDEKQKENYRKDIKKMVEHSDYLRKQDKDYLFDLMKKHIFSWWD